MNKAIPSITFSMDGQEIRTEQGQTILQAAQQNGIYIPSLCALYADQNDNLHADIIPGTCRVCTVKVNGRPMAACTTPAAQDLAVENDTQELNELRKSIIEMLFVEGNHFCPACEKSGTCDLQALAYRYKMLLPRFHYAFSPKEVNADPPNLLFDGNRCILCKRCVDAIYTDTGIPLFAFTHRGNKSTITVDAELTKDISDALAQKAMDICPVGAIIRKGRGFDTPIGKRKYDHSPIGSDPGHSPVDKEEDGRTT
ncbi:MAG: NADP oxidoreductase [Candidatus Electrothrix sp. AR4]|nr:NADP oxidoreductase [Candidatus Electrothrix sp. AR4]